MPLPTFRVLSRLDLKIATGGFKEEERLGAGPRGEVFRGRLGAASVAIKINLVDDGALKDPTVAKAYLKTLILGGPPAHPNIVPVIGVALDGGVCTVTPLAPGGSLESRLQALTWFQRLKVASGAFNGLEVLHAAKLVHGNLKATNILLAADGLDGLIADINTVAPSVDGMEQSVVNYYDPEYLAPGGQAKPSSDVYSMGVILL
eukprot:CAMPEP_0197611192 /NCGR_PEP_ID=MMETSP1326-20131121/54898_1 /TAXON_ID=1155430 /ORGANISM="Genus nov. species nov., Strain RCC2288" /LENGTH=203 /DNA_ID=CAMNT_0043179811 /DNA_START=294 /DNA_END=901 /DNA_ORIENTATION=-